MSLERGPQAAGSNSFSLRDLRWPEDRTPLCAIDTSFSTSRVYRVVGGADAFTLREAKVSPPLQKVYALSDEIDLFPICDRVKIAEQDGRVVGVAALAHDTYNGRGIIRHLYVDRQCRGQGIGRALMAEMASSAAEMDALCLWLETQDVNYPAIRFYRQAGFAWCGLDLSLDERDGSDADETAVFFMRKLEKGASR